MKLTVRQGFCLMSAFLLGNVLSGIGGLGQGEKIGYLSVFLSYGIFLLFVFFYHSIFTKNESSDFFSIIEKLFSPILQKIVFTIIAVGAFLSALFSVANYMEFIAVSTYHKTPITICLILVLALVLYLCLSREKAMGRYAEIVLPIILIAIFLLFFFGIRQWNFENLTRSFPPVTLFQQGISLFSGPFSEIIFIYFLSGSLYDNKKITKISIWAGFLVTVLFSGIYLFNLLILGENLMKISQFPTFSAASVVKVGTVIERAETLITFSYSFCDILYSAVCLLVCIKALGHLFSLTKKAKKITAVIAVILLGFIWFILKRTVTVQALYPIVTVILLPLTAGLPLTMFCLTLIHPKRKNQ